MSGWNILIRAPSLDTSIITLTFLITYQLRLLGHLKMFNKSVSDYFDFEIIIGLLLTLVMPCFGSKRANLFIIFPSMFKDQTLKLRETISSNEVLCENDEADV